MIAANIHNTLRWWVRRPAGLNLLHVGAVAAVEAVAILAIKHFANKGWISSAKHNELEKQLFNIGYRVALTAAFIWPDSIMRGMMAIMAGWLAMLLQYMLFEIAAYKEERLSEWRRFFRYGTS
jgi:hypothetical protein